MGYFKNHDSVYEQLIKQTTHIYICLDIYIYVWIYENGVKELHPTHLDFTQPLGLLQAKSAGKKIEKGRQ